MPEKVTISHRGARYEIGRGKRYYGIWVTGAPESDPVDRWPETTDGWAQAWARFLALETPESITEVKPERFRFPGLRRAGDQPEAADGSAGGAPAGGPVTAARVSAALLALGIIAGIAGLFPGYTGESLVSDASQLVPHLLYLAGWAAGGALLVTGLRRARAGALLAAGTSIMTFGLLGTDLAYVIAGQETSGAGLWLALAGWVLCTAGAIAGLAAKPPAPLATAPAAYPNNPAYPPNAYPRKTQLGPVALLLLGGLGTAASFAAPWDSYTATLPDGTSMSQSLGNAFQAPGAVITANIVVMVAIVAAAIVTAVWRPMRQGAALLIGALIPMAAQAISAVIQASQTPSAAVFGLTPAQQIQNHIAITSGLTPIFWVYCVFLIALAISCAWLMTEPAVPVMANPAPSPWAGPMMPAGEENLNQPPAPGNTAPENTVTENTAPENTGAQNSSPENTVAENGADN